MKDSRLGHDAILHQPVQLNLLLVFYEDLKDDYESTVRSVAEFMGVTDEHNIQTALERSTFEYMKIHSSKFSLGFLRLSFNAKLGLPENTGMDLVKIRTAWCNYRGSKDAAWRNSQ